MLIHVPRCAIDVPQSMLLDTLDRACEFLVEMLLAHDVPPDRELRERADQLRGDLHSGQLGFRLQLADNAMG